MICSCKTTKTSHSSSQTDVMLLEEFKDWQQDRLTSLKSPFGWLSLTGLYWVKADSLTVGTHDGFDINLAHSTSVNMGLLLRKDQGFYFRPGTGVQIKVEGKELTSEIELHHDQTGAPTILNHESLFWYLIKREDNYGIRLKDTLNQSRLTQGPIPSFDFSPSMRKKAKVTWAEAKDSILITNAQGVVSSNALKGWLEFEHEGKEYQLAGTDGGNDVWFIVFGDETNSGETYGAGRFLYVPVTPGSETAILDFNRAENPPCYFTAFATCPLPPKQNKLPIEIHAGEQSSH